MNPNIDIFATEDNLEGRYVNYFKVGYNADVFVIDYYQMFPEDEEAAGFPQHVSSPRLRLITSPSDVRQLVQHLESAVKNYEVAYGKIQGLNNQ